MPKCEGSRRICVVGSSKRFFGGITTHTIFLANALAKRNQVSVILLRNLLPRFLYPGRNHVGQGNYIVDFNPEINVYEGMDWNSPRSWYGAYTFLKEHKPDGIVMLWWTSSVAHMELFLILANRLKIKAKLILEMHEIVDPLEESILPLRLYSRLAGKLIMRGTDAFTTQSTSAKNQVAQVYRLDERRIFVVPVGLYEAYACASDKNQSKKELGIEEEFVILYFGMVRKYKGVPCLVEAFNKLPQDVAQHSRLVIAGEDWGDETCLGDMISSSHRKEQITYKPQFIPDDMIPEYFSAADVVVLPYLRTAGSGVANIAMAYGKPIITSDVATMRECMADYEGAWFTPVADSAAIAERLMQIYSEHKSGKPLIYSPPRNTWDTVAQKCEAILGQLGAGR
jgi:glycosyltransferase involved in cell wall biosynthesis